jgi:RHS repeat-associated protein
LGNGFTAHRAIDLDGRIAGYSLGNATVSLGYDAASRITSAQESGTTGSRIFDYDPLDRLIHTQVPSAVYDYSYDATGNRLTEKVAGTTFNYTYPTTSHRLASVSGPKARSFSYDANGSMTGNGSQQFVYNSLGRLHQVITALGTYQYRINGLGQRVMKIPPTGNRTIFHYDENGRLLSETDGLGVVVKEFIWHGATPVAVVLPPTSTKPERIYYIHADQLNTPRAVVNANNAVLWRWDPEPFGTALPNEDVDGNGEKLVMNIRYPGQYYDQETGLNYNNFRDYDASIGRYVQSDPIGLAGGINTYAYVGGNPVNGIDPLGLYPGQQYVDYAGGVVGGTGDFVSQYFNQLDATYWTGRSHNGWANQDKYFHCMANCEASQRGRGGEDTAVCISNARETTDQLMGDPPSASAADQVANKFGRSQGAVNPNGSCQNLCGKYRPGGSFPF